MPSLRSLVQRKWSRRSKLFAVVAVACGLLTFRIVNGYAVELEALRPLAGDVVPVVVATEALVRGAPIAEGDVRLAEMPAAFAPPGAVGGFEEVVGQTLVSDVLEGEAITTARISASGGPVASLVPSGFRAFPVTASVPPGSVRAGDRVDVIATYGGPRPYSDTVATALEVLATTETDDGALVATAGGTTSLLLLVTSETAEQLAYAAAYADLAVSIAPVRDDVA